MRGDEEDEKAAFSWRKKWKKEVYLTSAKKITNNFIFMEKRVKITLFLWAGTDRKGAKKNSWITITALKEESKQGKFSSFIQFFCPFCHDIAMSFMLLTFRSIIPFKFFFATNAVIILKIRIEIFFSRDMKFSWWKSNVQWTLYNFRVKEKIVLKFEKIKHTETTCSEVNIHGKETISRNSNEDSLYFLFSSMP